MIGGEDILALAVGADVGLQHRRNEQALARGEYPSFWQRHPLLTYVLGAVVGVPVILVLLVFVVPGWMLGTVWLDQHLGNTGVIDLLGFTAFLWVPGLRAFIRAERRYRRPPPTTSLVQWKRP